MPHILLETTADLPENGHVPDVLEALVRKLAAFESVNAASIKAYHTLRSVWCVGEGHPPGVAHCTVKIVSGRPPELKRAIAEGMYQELRSHFTQSLEAEEVGLTLELHEMDGSTYIK